MSRVKSKKDIDEKEMKDYSLLQIKIWSINDRNTVVVNLEPFGDEEKAADTMVGWLQYWCIGTLLHLVSDMLNDDTEKKLLLIHDRVKQIKEILEDMKIDLPKDDSREELDKQITENKKEEREKDITDIAKFFKSLLN